MIISEPIFGQSKWRRKIGGWCESSKEKKTQILGVSPQVIIKSIITDHSEHNPLYQHPSLHYCDAIGSVQRAISSLSLFLWGWPLWLQHRWCHRGSVKEEPGLRERPTDIRWMLGNAVCVQQEHTAGSESEAPWNRRAHTHTHTHTHTHVRRHAVLKHPTHWWAIQRSFTVIHLPSRQQRVLLMLVVTYWMGRRCYPAVYHHSSPLFTCQSVWVKLRS